MVRVAFELESTESAGREARQRLRAQLADTLPAITLYDLLTVATELVTNAVKHGRGKTVLLRLRIAGDGIVCGEVENEGRPPLDLRPVEASARGGLGLHIVDAISRDWSVEADESTRVRFELREP